MTTTQKKTIDLTLRNVQLMNKYLGDYKNTGMILVIENHGELSILHFEKNRREIKFGELLLVNREEKKYQFIEEVTEGYENEFSPIIEKAIQYAIENAEAA